MRKVEISECEPCRYYVRFIEDTLSDTTTTVEWRVSDLDITVMNRIQKFIDYDSTWDKI